MLFVYGMIDGATNINIMFNQQKYDSIAVVFLGGEATQLAVDATAPVVATVTALQPAGPHAAPPAPAAQATAPAWGTAQGRVALSDNI